MEVGQREGSPFNCNVLLAIKGFQFSDDTFDWYNMLKEEITAGMEEEAQNDFKFTVQIVSVSRSSKDVIIRLKMAESFDLYFVRISRKIQVRFHSNCYRFQWIVKK